MSNDEEPQGRRRRLRGTRVPKDEILRDSHGRLIDDAYVDQAVEDALAKVVKDRQSHKA